MRQGTKVPTPRGYRRGRWIHKDNTVGNEQPNEIPNSDINRTVSRRGNPCSGGRIRCRWRSDGKQRDPNDITRASPFVRRITKDRHPASS